MLHKILRGINSENTYILLQNTYITVAFKIGCGDTNFGVSPRGCNPKKENSTSWEARRLELLNCHQLFGKSGHEPQERMSEYAMDVSRYAQM